jgi:ASPIC and UnbV.
MFSNGSAYGDLDNDGDLDLVVSNINAPATVYRNNSDSSKYKSISVALKSKGNNTFAVGAQVSAYCNGQLFIADNFVTRGFQSSVSPEVVIGLGEGITSVDSLLVKWPDGGHSAMYNQPSNKRLNLTKPDEVDLNYSQTHRTNFKLQPIDQSIFRHQQSGLVDFNRDRLLPMMYSNESPAMTKGDIDGDGKAEVYIGGGKDQSGTFIKMNDENHINSQLPKSISQYSLAEESKCAIMDIDQDGDLDFYFASGGRFFPNTSTALSDKIFLNKGNGDFVESTHALPFTRYISTSVVKPIDFDKDGDVDLFVGERFDPFIYGIGGGGFLLENNGSGLFKDVTKEFAPDLLGLGMITDAEVRDIDTDGWKDLILVGDWMPIVALRNDKGVFKNISAQLNITDTEGWWHDIESTDLNKDGKPDFVVGNHGLNTFFKSADRMYVSDFDGNGSVEQIFCTKVNDLYFPIVDKDEFLAQLPSLKKQLLYYKTYGSKSIDQLFSTAALEKSKIFEVKNLASSVWLSGSEGYRMIQLPMEAQYSPIYSLLLLDFDNDGIEDLIAGGNHYQVKPQFGRYDASNGWFFKGVLKDNQFSFERGVNLGIKGQIRDIEWIEINQTKYILFAKYDNELEICKVVN